MWEAGTGRDRVLTAQDDERVRVQVGLEKPVRDDEHGLARLATDLDRCLENRPRKGSERAAPPLRRHTPGTGLARLEIDPPRVRAKERLRCGNESRIHFVANVHRTVQYAELKEHGTLLWFGLFYTGAFKVSTF